MKSELESETKKLCLDAGGLSTKGWLGEKGGDDKAGGGVGGRGLPYAEPLTEEEKEMVKPLYELFSDKLIHCFYSQNWSTRLQAINAIHSQLHFIQNPPSASNTLVTVHVNPHSKTVQQAYQIFQLILQEALNHPVIQIYIAALQLFQTSLPMFLAHMDPHDIRTNLKHIIQIVIQKMGFLKLKVREKSAEFLKLKER